MQGKEVINIYIIYDKSRKPAFVTDKFSEFKSKLSEFIESDNLYEVDVRCAHLISDKNYDGSDIDIIEKPDDETYGISNIYSVDNGYNIQMYQNRMEKSFFESGTFRDAFLDISDNSKSYTDNKPDLISAVNSHLKFWLQAEQTESVIMVHILTKEELTLLLRTGFSSDRIFVHLI